MKATAFNILTGTLIGGGLIVAGFMSWPIVEASVHEVTRPKAIPTGTQAFSECAITEAGRPFWVDVSDNNIPRALVLTCDGDSITVEGDFTTRTSNNYDVDATGIRSAVVVENAAGLEARIWHVRDMYGHPGDCLTIQDVGSSGPSRDECIVRK